MLGTLRLSFLLSCLLVTLEGQTCTSLLTTYVLVFFQDKIILGSDYPFPLGELNPPGKIIDEMESLSLSCKVMTNILGRSYRIHSDKSAVWGDTLKNYLKIDKKYTPD